MDLVTGATGFVGNALARQLVRCGRSVCVLGRRACGIPGIDREILLPLKDQAVLAEALAQEQFDLVFHLAAYGVLPTQRDTQEMCQLNTQFPAFLLTALSAAPPRGIVFAGTSAEYARLDIHRPLRESDPLETSKLYGASKAAGALLAQALAADSKLPFAYLRLFQLYGSGEAPHRLLSQLRGRLAAGEQVALSSGEQVRDFLHVDDATQALVTAALALENGAMKPGSYNVGSGRAVSVAGFSRQVARAMGSNESNLAFGAIAQRPDDLPYVVADATAFARETGWQPARTLEERVHQTLSELSEAEA